jgi:hypothetical protein
MNLKKLLQVARLLGISNESARKLAKTRWTTYRLGPGSLVVDLDQILAEAQEKPEGRAAKAQKQAL